MTRETFTGVLHVIHPRKDRRSGSGIGALVSELVNRDAENRGLLPVRYWPPTYYVRGPATVGAREPGSVAAQRWGGEPYQLRFRGRPKALRPDLRGHTIEVVATVVPFGNGLGGYLDRPRVVRVGEPVECPYHDDPFDPDDIVPGSARVYCHPAVTARAKELSDLYAARHTRK